MALHARVGDSISHGGSIITGSHNVLTNGIPQARLGDLATCAIHGILSIVTGSPNVYANGRPIARTGDVCSCGAVIVSGSFNTHAN